MKKLLLLLFVLALMACGQKEPAEEAPATDETMEQAAPADTAMSVDTTAVDAEEAAPEQ